MSWYSDGTVVECECFAVDVNVEGLVSLNIVKLGTCDLKISACGEETHGGG